MTRFMSQTTARRASRAVCFAGALLSGISCRDESTEPAGPAQSDAALATTSAALPFDFISAGDLHTCAIATDDRAWCWGWNVFGQLGDGTINTERFRPVLVKGGFHFSQLSAGNYSTCGVTLASKMHCWGGTPAVAPGTLQFRQVSVGSEHGCGVTTDDRAFCWGSNTFGQLGNGTWNPVGVDAVSPVAVTGNHLFREVTVGNYHSCGVTTDNRAYCWGGDQWGQIGDGSSSSTCGFSLPCRKVPALVAGGYRFRQVDAGGGYGPGEGGIGGDDGGHTCGVTTDNRALCWGEGQHGQNGDGTSMLRKAPVLVAGGLAFRSVSVGIYHVCGVTTGSVPYCWGGNWAGMLGDGTLTQRNQPKLVSGGHFFRQVSAGGGHTCGVTAGNVAWCWGIGSAVGDGTSSIRKMPVKVVGPS